MKLVGVEEKKGTFENREYHNYIFHCTNSFDNGSGEGIQVSSHKIKAKVLTEVLGKEISLIDVKAFLGQEVKCFYDQYKNVSYVIFNEVPATQAFPNGNATTGFGKAVNKSN